MLFLWYIGHITQPFWPNKDTCLTSMLKVVFVLCEHMLATSVTLPLEQLHAADTLYRSQHKLRLPSLEAQLVSVDGLSVKSHTGIKLNPDKALSETSLPDIVFLPALWRNPKPILKKNNALIPWLVNAYENGCVVAGVGTGCCFMAEAGLLDNKPATTHWFFFDEFQRWYPQVLLKRQYFITQAGNLFCTGSVNSMADLIINFIERYYTREIASHVERHFFHEIRRAYEGETSLLEPAIAHPDETIVQIQNWMQSNYEKNVSFNDLAQQFKMSLRTLNRRFKKATDITPSAYLQKIRMAIAKDLLQTSNLTINEIVYRVGYHDSAHFTSLFKKHIGITPSDYRTTVRAKLFSV